MQNCQVHPCCSVVWSPPVSSFSLSSVPRLPLSRPQCPFPLPSLSCLCSRSSCVASAPCNVCEPPFRAAFQPARCDATGRPLQNVVPRRKISASDFSGHPSGTARLPSSLSLNPPLVILARGRFANRIAQSTARGSLRECSMQPCSCQGSCLDLRCLSSAGPCFQLHPRALLLGRNTVHIQRGTAGP